MKRSLLLIPLGVALNAAIFALSPYSEIASAMAPEGPFEAAPTESLPETYERLRTLGDAGRTQYVAMQGWDLGAIAGNALILLPLLIVGAHVARAPRAVRGIVIAIGALPLAIDVLENAFLLAVIRANPLTESMCTSAALVTTAKWMAFMLALGLIALVWLAALLRRLRGAPAPVAPAPRGQRGCP